MESSPKVCKFSSENWKIIDNLKEEKRKLQAFNASTADLDESNDSLHNSKALSPTDYIEDAFPNSKHHTINPVKLIKVEDYCRPSLCNLVSYYNCNNNNKDDETPSENRRDGPNDSAELKWKTEQGHVVPAEKKDPFQNMPCTFKAVISCLLSIPKFKDFLQIISSELISNFGLLKVHLRHNDAFFSYKNGDKSYPSIEFFINRYTNESKQHLKHCTSRDTSSVYSEESISCLILSMLEIFHEELVQARHCKILSKTCMKGCRLVQKHNHTIVSHLFRGHYKQKSYCECNEVIKENKSFTVVSVNLDEFNEKTLIIQYLHRDKESYLSVQRYLFSISRFSTIKGLKEKFTALQKNQNTNMAAEQCHFVVALIKQNVHVTMLGDNVKIIDAMADDGIFWIFNVSSGQLSINVLSQSMDANSKDSVPSQISSAVESSEILKIESTSLIKKNNCNVVVKVLIKWIEEFGTPSFALLVQLPRISNGLHIFERMSRVIGFHHSNFQNIILTITNKAEQCLICLSSCCLGCPVQMNDKVTLSDHYEVNLKMAMFTRHEVIQYHEDISITLNQPINFITVEECFDSYIQRKDVKCPSCFQTLSTPADTFLLKRPEVLCLCFSMATSDSTLSHAPSILPKENLKSIFNKKFNNIYYELHSVTYTNTEIPSISKRYVGKNTLNGVLKDDICKPSNEVATLFYIKHKVAEYKYNGQRKMLKKMKMKEKSAMMFKSKFSPRTGHLTTPMGHVSSTHHQADFEESFSGRYTNRSSYASTITDQQSSCNCLKCKTLDKFHSQILQSRSTLTSEKKLDEQCSVSTDRSTCCSSQSTFPSERMLHKAIRNQDLKAFVKGLHDGADVNLMLKGMSALHLVAGMSEPFGSIFTKVCLEYGGDCNLACSNDGLTPVHIAVLMNNEEILALLLKAGGVPSLKDSQGRSAFDVLVQSDKGNSECLLRLLRGEAVIDNKRSELESNEHHVINECLSLDVSKLEKDRISINERILGETTFDQIFNLNTTTPKPFSSDPLANKDRVENLDESVVSQHFTEIDNSNPSFNGSIMRTWLSWFSCSGRFSKIRRRQNEERYVTRVVRRRFSKWLNNIRARLGISV